MHSCIFNQQTTRRSDGLYYLVLCLPERSYSGLVGEAAPPPVCLLMSIRVGFWPLGLFCFTRCIPNTSTFWKNTWLICYILKGSPFWFLNVSGVFVSSEVVFVWRFPKEALKLLANFLQYFPRNMACFSIPISLGVSALVAGSSDIWPLV